VNEPTGEILPVWFCLLSGSGGSRQYYNGPFASEAQAVEFGQAVPRRFEIRQMWLPSEDALKRLARPRLWVRHPWARSSLVAERGQGPEGDGAGVSVTSLPGGRPEWP